MGAAPIAIVGGGVAGLATAASLARRGARCVLLESDARLGQQSSRLNAAILRTHTGHPLLSAFARRGADFWAAPPRGFARGPLLDACGLVLWSPRAGAEALERAVAADSPAERYRRLDAAQVRARAPLFAFDPEGVALCFEGEGRLAIAAYLEALAAEARAAGSELRAQARVRGLLVQSGRVAGVELEDGARVEATAVVLAAGAWAAALGRAAGSRVALRPTRRHLLVTEPDARIDARHPVVWSAEPGFYARPERGGWLLSGCDEAEIEPEANAADPLELEAIRAKAAQLLPGGTAGRPRHFWSGLRTFAPQERFCIGWDADLDGLFWVAGLAGHGMSCGPAVGELAAELLLRPAPAGEWARAFDPALARA